MHLSTSDAYNLIKQKKITNIFLIRYVHEGNITDDEGPIEIHFECGLALLFECGSDGEEMTMKKGEWVDPFSGEQSEENIEFIRENGKWEKMAQEQTGTQTPIPEKRVNELYFYETKNRKDDRSLSGHREQKILHKSRVRRAQNIQ